MYSIWIDSAIEIPIRSFPLPTPQFARYGLLILAPADQQKVVTCPDETRILRIWTGEPGFVGGVLMIGGWRGEEVDHRVEVVSRVITCRPPMRCVRWRTINHERTTPALKDEKATPAVSTSGEPALTQMAFLDLAGLSKATTSSSFFHCQECTECIDFLSDSIARIHAVPRLPLYMFDPHSRLFKWLTSLAP